MGLADTLIQCALPLSRRLFFNQLSTDAEDKSKITTLQDCSISMLQVSVSEFIATLHFVINNVIIFIVTMTYH